MTQSGLNEVLNQAIGHVRIGNILMAAGIISYEFLREALDKFEEHGMPLGKILTMSGYLNEAQLRKALEIQHLVNSRQLPLDVGVRVLSLAHQENCSLAEAFERAKVVQPDDLLSNKLGQFLTAAEIITQQTLEEALEVNQRSGLPLGHILCYRNVMSYQLLETALLAQQLVRRASLSREQAIASVTAARLREKENAKLPINSGFRRTVRRGTPRLGELLFSCELIDDAQLITALQTSLAKAIPSGQAVLALCGLNPDVILDAVQIQELIDNDVLEADAVREIFMRMREFSLDCASAVAQTTAGALSGNPGRLLVQLLRDTNVVGDDLTDEIRERIAVNYNQSCQIAKECLALGLPGPVVTAALRLSYLITIQKIPYERALVALEGVKSEAVSADEALIAMGAINRTRLRF